MRQPLVLRRGLAAIVLSGLALAASCPSSSPPDTTPTIPFDNFRLDVPAGKPLNNFDRTYPIFAGPQAADFSLHVQISNLPSTGRVEMQKGDGSVLQTITSNGPTVTGSFGGNIGRIRVRLPGITHDAPDVMLSSITTQRHGVKQFPALSPPMTNLATAFPLRLGEPVDFAISDLAPDDAYFSVAGLGGAPFDLIVIGAAAVWFETSDGDFPLSSTEASQPVYSPSRGDGPSFSLQQFALFRFPAGRSTLRLTVTNQCLTRLSGVRDPFHVRVIAVPAGPAQSLSFPSEMPLVFDPFPIGVDTNPASSRGTTGTPADKLDCTNWAGVSAGTVTVIPSVAVPETTSTTPGSTIVTPAGRLVCYDGHTGSDFLIAPASVHLRIPANAAASGFVVQTATGNIDTCHADVTTASGISCPGTPDTNPNFVIVRQDDGLFARYYHLKNDTPPVKPGDRVRCGDFLGHVGSSGPSATPHLHFELDTLSAAQAGAVLNNVDQSVWDLIHAGAPVVVDPYPGSWTSTVPGPVPLFTCP